MIYILDTTVISAVRRPDRAPQVARWLGARDEAELFVSFITLGEIERGIALQARTNPGFAADLRGWITRTVSVFGDRILDFTEADARYGGTLSARIGHPGADLMIAAQALARNATVVTGNTADFMATGVQLVHPFA